MSYALDRPRELRWCRAANRWGGRPRILRFFSVVSRLGDGVFWYALIAALALLGGATGRTAALHMAAVGIVALLLYRCLKGHYRRPRPFRSDHAIVPLMAPLDEFSFPSGHTLHAISFSLVACAYFPALVVLLLPFTACVAASRVVLGLHYPSDVLAAALIGSALVMLSFAPAWI